MNEGDPVLHLEFSYSFTVFFPVQYLEAAAFEILPSERICCEIRTSLASWLESMGLIN